MWGAHFILACNTHAARQLCANYSTYRGVVQACALVSRPRDSDSIGGIDISYIRILRYNSAREVHGEDGGGAPGKEERIQARPDQLTFTAADTDTGETC